MSEGGRKFEEWKGTTKGMRRCKRTTPQVGYVKREKTKRVSDKGKRGRELSGWREGVMSKVKSDHKWEKKRGR